MTSYTAIPNGDIDQDSPVTQPLMQLLRDNPLAIAEGDPTAPVNQAIWHPYDMVFANDGAIGRFYNGTVVASVTTPTMVAGYDYMFRGQGLSHNNGAAANFLVNGVAVQSYSNAEAFSFTFWLLNPAVTNHPKYPLDFVRSFSGANGETNIAAFTNNATALTSFAFSFSAGSFDAGQIFMYRRRNYMP